MTLDTRLTQAPGTGGPQRHTAWLTTINPDASPQVMPVGVVRRGGSWYFSSGPAPRRGKRKTRNLARDPRCAVSATEPFDLVIEGIAERITDSGELVSLAEAFNEGSWPAEVAGDALTADYSAPSAGPAPWHVFRVQPSTVFAFGAAEPFGATKFQLD